MAVPTDGIKDTTRQAKRDESLIDGIAAALRGEESLEDFLGSDDPEKMHPEEKKIYQSIVSYLKKTGDDLPINVDELPDMEDTFDQSPDDNFLYPVDLAAEVFDSIAVNTVEQVKYEAQQDTLKIVRALLIVKTSVILFKTLVFSILMCFTTIMIMMNGLGTLLLDLI